MSDDKESKNNQHRDDEEKRDDENVQKDLDDILGSIKESEKGGSESDRKKAEEAESGQQEEQPEPQSTPEPTEEGVDQILERISEKDKEPVEEMNAFQRVVGVFTQPTKVFAYLKNKPEYMLPLIIAILISIISSILVFDIAINDQIRKYERSERFTNDQKNMIIDNLEASKTGARRYISTIVVPGISMLVIFALVSAIFLFIGNVILGGKARFVQIFSAYAYSYLIVAIVGTIVKLPLWLSQNTLKVDTNLAVFLPGSMEKSTIYNFFTAFDIFTIWFLIVFGIGFAIIYRFSQLKGIISVITAWLVYVVISKVILGNFFAGIV